MDSVISTLQGPAKGDRGPEPTPRPGVMNVAHYVPGDALIDGVGDPVRLAANESALGPSPAAMEAYCALAAQIHRYPEGAATALREALSAHHRINADWIVCGGGSDDLINLLCHSYAGVGDEVVCSRHAYAVFPTQAVAAGAKVVAVPEVDFQPSVDGLLSAVTARTRVVFVANPANPTGACLSASEVARLQKGLPRRTLLILDAAYAEFVDRDDFQAGEDLVESSDNVVILRTFSKAYALAGLRVGWAYCTPSVADVLNRVRGPYNVSLPAQAAAIAALGDTARLAEARRHNIVWRGWLTQGLRGLGLRVLPSETNFLAVHLGSEVRANEGFEFLRSNGILARRLDSYGMDEWLRTSVGLECEVRRVQAAFQAFCGGALAPRRLSDRP